MKRIFDKNEHMHTPMSQQHHEYTSHRPTIHLNVQHVYLCNNLISIHHTVQPSTSMCNMFTSVTT